MSGAFSRRAKKAGAQQLALKINDSSNPAALRLASDKLCGTYIANTNDAVYRSLQALAMRGIAAFLFSALVLNCRSGTRVPYLIFEIHLLEARL
jgi:hypothetical protein